MTVLLDVIIEKNEFMDFNEETSMKDPKLCKGMDFNKKCLIFYLSMPFLLFNTN